MEIEGYKALNKDHTNRYGMLFEEGKSYSVNGDVSFGTSSKNGFHMCSHLADVFRYFDSDESVVAKVIGKGKMVSYNDEYYSYFDMYAVSEIKIVKFLTREEIITEMLNTNSFYLEKFLMTFKLTDTEKILFLKKWQNDLHLQKLILYYQYHQKDVNNLSDIEIKRRVWSMNNG